MVRGYQVALVAIGKFEGGGVERGVGRCTVGGRRAGVVRSGPAGLRVGRSEACVGVGFDWSWVMG